MKQINAISIFFLLSLNSLYAQIIPKLGNDTLLDIACWNVEWFGDATPGNGPDDETTQYSNVKAMLDQTDFDILGLEEISNVNTYYTLTHETSIAAKYDAYLSTFSATQKMGLFWKKSMFDVIGSATLNILTSEYTNFGTRPPLQVCLKTKGGSKTDTLYVLVLHMKANTGTDAAKLDSYTRRQNAAVALKNYLETTLLGKKYVVIGDWNDDLNISIYNSQPSPYANLLAAAYTFVTKELTDAGKKSYIFGSAMIDHILNSGSMDSFYYKGSARVFDIAGNYIVNYSTSTSDHYPVYANYNWNKLTTYQPPASTFEIFDPALINVFPNPANAKLNIDCNQQIVSVKLYNCNAHLLIESKDNQIDMSSIPTGIYFIVIQTEKGVYKQKISKD